MLYLIPSTFTDFIVHLYSHILALELFACLFPYHLRYRNLLLKFLIRLNVHELSA